MGYIYKIVFRDIDIPTKLPNEQNKNLFCFIVCGYNNRFWILLNLRSIFIQQYRNFKVIIIDDCSTDNSVQTINEFVNKHNLQQFVEIITNEKNMGPAYSRYIGIQKANDNDILCFLDGDDWLICDNALDILNDNYNKGCLMTVGTHVYLSKLRKLGTISGRSDIDINHPKRYHLRTGYKYIWNDMPINYIKDNSGEFIRYCTDFNELVWGYSKIDKTKFVKIFDFLCIYNKSGPTTESNTIEYKTKIINELKNKWISL